MVRHGVAVTVEVVVDAATGTVEVVPIVPADVLLLDVDICFHFRVLPSCKHVKVVPFTDLIAPALIHLVPERAAALPAFAKIALVVRVTRIRAIPTNRLTVEPSLQGSQKEDLFDSVPHFDKSQHPFRMMWEIAGRFVEIGSPRHSTNRAIDS